MSFKRARNKEQKQVRIRQILTAASQLLEEYSYKDISLEMIANKLDFSRANISRYIATKEEIFLALFVDDMTLLCNEVVKQKNKEGELDISQFAYLMARVCTEHKNFLQIGAILNTIIEQNIDAKTLANYKKLIFQCRKELSLILKTNFSFLKEEDSIRLVMALYHYISGAYPAANITAIQKEAIILSGFPYYQQDFVEILAEFIILMLTGYKQLQNNSNLSKS